MGGGGVSVKTKTRVRNRLITRFILDRSSLINLGFDSSVLFSTQEVDFIVSILLYQRAPVLVNNQLHEP